MTCKKDVTNLPTFTCSSCTVRKMEHFIQSSYNHLKQIDKSVIILISPVNIYTRCNPPPPPLIHHYHWLSALIRYFCFTLYTFVIATSIIYLGVAVLWLKYCEDSLTHQTINQSMNIYICMPVIDSVVSRIFPIKLNIFFISLVRKLEQQSTIFLIPYSLPHCFVF